MAKRIPKNFGKDSKLQAMRVSASTLITDTIEELQSRYENKGVSEQTLRAIAPLVEEGEDPDVLLARQDFDFFCTKISSVFKPTLHHQVWNRSLITEESNKYLHRIAGQNTSILSPRGSAKSTKLGLFCAWAIGIHAEQQMALQMLYISANRELALAKSETIRNVISSDSYQKIFPFVQPHPKKWASPLWSIDRTAAGIETTGQEEFTCIAAGILGTIASKRCFTGDTLIETDQGIIPIKTVPDYEKLSIASFNHRTMKVEFNFIKGFASRPSSRIVTVYTQSNKVRCTEDHRFYTPLDGYKEARLLTREDVVIARSEKGWKYELIEMVVREDAEEVVYDIQVEGNSNFFANEILAHNCNLILYDDLVKNAEDIASPSVRRKMVRTHYSVVMPTLFPGGRILAINTRYRPDDIHVTDFIPTKGWNVLEQSAIIPRRELIRLGTFKEGVSKVTAVSSEALDEQEAIKMARQEETRLALQRAIKQASSKKDGHVGDDPSKKDSNVQDDSLNGNFSSLTPSPKDNVLSSSSFSSSPFSEQAIQLSEQLQSIKEYGVAVKAITDFDTEEEWEEYLDEEVSYWEAMWSLSYLQGRRTADATSFVYQYQNKVEQAEGQGIPPEHIKYGRPPAQYDYFCIGGDLATSKSNKADYTVFCLVGKADSQYWVLDYWRGKVTGNLQKIEHILDLYENWADDPLAGSITPWRIALEKVSYQASISDDLTRELYHKRMLSNIVVSPTQLKGGKEAHMASITGAFANGLVTFNEGIEWGPFVEELQGLGAHDDCVDALVIALQTLGVRRRLATVDTEEELLKLQSHYELNHFTSPYTDPYHGHWI